MVINVEYNQLDPLLRATGFPDGDVNCETGYSPFPGNINQVWLVNTFSHLLSILLKYFWFCFPVLFIAQHDLVSLLLAFGVFFSFPSCYALEGLQVEGFMIFYSFDLVKLAMSHCNIRLLFVDTAASKPRKRRFIQHQQPA